ncbi:MAG: glutathione S-transferase family protein [Acetobacteraceae bacterium]|nr:glutathione S-transferase family protein [Acetobacteraceae bacterium]
MKILINTTSPYARIARIALWEKGCREAETQIVDPWGDTPDLLAANPAARVPTLITDDGQVLTESLLIVLWLEKTRPEPSLLPGDPTAGLARAGIAMGVIDAAVHTLIGRKIAGPAFDESPVGVRRQRTMAEGLGRLDADAPAFSGEQPTLPAITSVVALDYVRFRFPNAAWMPRLERLGGLRREMQNLASIEQTIPYG